MRRRGPALCATAVAGVLLVACSTVGQDEPADGAARTPAAGSTTPATSPGTQQPEPTPDPSSFTVVASGDVLIHPPVMKQAARDAAANGAEGYDFRDIFAGVKPVVEEADLAICHLEVPLAPPSGPFEGYPTFSAPPQVAEALADTGYDTCSTASNHTLDQGADGVSRTLDTLEAAGIRHAGSARSRAEARRSTLLDVQGVTVAQLSYTFGFNGIPLPEGKPWLSNRIDRDRILGDAADARRAGAEVVIVSLHWGAEYRHRPTATQRSLAEALLGSPDVDLILGHHAHVTQPFERVGGKWVAYGLGNHVARHAEPRGVSEEAVIARFTFTREGTAWQVSKAEYLPQLIDLGPPIRVIDLGSALEGPTLPEAVRERYEDAHDRISEVVLSYGAATAGAAAGR